MNNKTIVGIGELLFDIFLDRKILGGAPTNFAYHISQFGYNGYALSAIGEDLLGKEILNSLKEKHLNHLVETTGYQTGTVKVSLSGGGVPQYEICENVAWDNIPYTPKTESLAKNTQAVCFGSLAQRNELSRKTIHKFIQTMPLDSLKIFDINLRLNYYTKQIIHDSLTLSNVLKINDEEIVAIAKLFNWSATDEEICRRLQNEYDLTLVILTKGEVGSLVFTRGNDVCTQQAPKVRIADTVGAGDSFTAAFFASYLHGNDIKESHQLAIEVAAYVCTQQGAMPKLPDTYLKLFI